MLNPSFCHHLLERPECTLSVYESGDGYPLVLLHGGLADHRGAVYHGGALARSFRLITPDLRAAGRSHWSGPLSWHHHVDDLATTLDTLGIDQAIIGGYSAGTGVALAFAFAQPHRCAGLLLVAPMFLGKAHGHNPAQQAAMTCMHKFGEQAVAHGIEALLPLYADVPPAIREPVMVMARSFDPASVATTTRFLLHGPQPFEELRDLARLSMPTLIVAGQDDEHPAELARAYAEHMPSAELVDASEPLSTACERVFLASGG